MRAWIVVSVLSVSISMLSACGDDENGGDAGACVDYSAVSGSASLINDVMPVFQNSCALSASCHASSAANAAGGLKLGPDFGEAITAADATAVHAAIVGVTATGSSMKLVAAGDPAASWLMAKIDYEDPTACSTTSCSSCGSRMPPLPSDALPEATLAKIRQWIKDGAQDN